MTDQRAPRPIVDEITPWRSALAAVSRALRSPELREQLRQARTVDAIKALFVKDQAPATAA